MKIYNTTGSLSTVLRELHKKRIRDFKSLNDITEFQNSYILFRQRIILNHQELLEQEKSSLELALRLLPSQIEDQKVRKEQNLNADILSLKHKIQSLRDEIQSLSAEVGSLKVENLKIKKYLVLTTACARRWYKETFFDIIISNSAARLSWQLKKKVKRYKNITSNYDKVLTKSYKSEIKKLESKKAALDELQPFILGAIGEERVVNCLVCLPDEYSLINDFRVRFSNPISSNNIEKVKSIQADHILIGPSGVFLIETKNWSRDSVQNPNLRSPIIQVRRDVRANLAIANDAGPFEPGPDNTTPFPAILEIDYIRVWTRLDCEKIINICNYNQTNTDLTVITGKQITVGGSNCNATIQNGQNLKLIATESISLKPGFHAEAGSNFHAKIVDCPGPQKSIENVQNTDSTLRIVSEIIPDSLSLNNVKSCAKLDNPPILYTKIYPNPTEGRITIEFVGKIDRNIKVSLVNSIGHTVFSQDNITSNSIVIDISILPKGIYVLTGIFGSNSVSEKIILN